MKKVFFILGPTAVGKSEIAVELARQLDGEIISADSMQVYKGMDIGTAKPSLRLRNKIPHYLIDVVSPSTAFSVFRFRQLALKAIQKICAKGKVPIVAGGSGLYVRAILEGISEQPGADPELRKELSQAAAEKGLPALYQKLQEQDPLLAAKIKPADKKRIIRALEIIHVSGQRPSDWYQKKTSLQALGFEPVVIGMTKDRALLYRDIETRVDEMFRRGFVQEVKTLMRTRMSRTAREAIGYREISQALRKPGFGPASLPPLKEIIKRNTRRFAKRQMTWFKKEKGIQWLSRCNSESLSDLCRRIADLKI